MDGGYAWVTHMYGVRPTIVVIEYNAITSIGYVLLAWHNTGPSPTVNVSLIYVIPHNLLSYIVVVGTST